MAGNYSNTALGGFWQQRLMRDSPQHRLLHSSALSSADNIPLQGPIENFPLPSEQVPKSSSPLVYVSRNLWQYCVNTLHYIGEHPLEFALSVGMSMAVRWAVTAGIVAVSGGAVAGLGLAIASAMITSVVLGVGKKMLKGESINAEDITGKAVLSGVIAGAIGAFIGGKIPAPDTHPMVLDTGSEYIPHYTPSMLACYTGTENVTDQYVWDIKEWQHLQDRFALTGDKYLTIDYGETKNAYRLLRSNADWYVFVDENQHPYQLMHRNALVEMMDVSKQHAHEAGLHEFSKFSITNDRLPNASIGPATSWSGYRQYELTFYTGGLTDEKDIFIGSLDHELGHLHYFMKEPVQNLSEIQQEVYADKFMLRNDNYGGYIEGWVRGAIETGSLDRHSHDHPTDRMRIEEGIKAAAVDPTLTIQEQEALRFRLEECQQMLKENGMGKQINLLKLLERELRNTAETQAVDPAHSAASEVADKSWQEKMVSGSNVSRILG